MPNYFYTAKSFDGQTKKGNFFTKDLRELAEKLKSENMVLIEATTKEEKRRDAYQFFLPSFGISSTQRIMMVRNLWIMFAAGLSLVKIFTILSTQAKKPKLKKMMLDINERLNKGETLSGALDFHKNVFDEFFRSMVKIGEESGTLEGVFEILSLHMERDHELKSKIRGALIYPFIIIIVMGGIGIVVSTFVLPKFSSFLLGMGIELPIYTRILIGIGNFSQHYWYVTLIVLALALYGFFMARRTKPGKRLQDTVLMRIPLLASFVKKANATIMVRSLSSLNSSGISLVRSLEITSSTIPNVYFKDALIQSIEKVKKGEKLSTSLRPYENIFPLGAIDMMEVGEETGKTSVVLKKLSEFYEQEVIEETKNFSVIIEPILLIFLGLVVAFFAISIIEPMYSSLKGI